MVKTLQVEQALPEGRGIEEVVKGYHSTSWTWMRWDSM